MTDVVRLRTEAQKAQAEADAAARRAAAAAAQAEAALQRAYEEQAARRHAWAQGVVDAYDADLAATDRAVQEARDRFAAAAVGDPASATAAYVAWAEAAIRHYTLQVRLGSVAPALGLETTPPEHLGPPHFSRALDWAIDRHVDALADKARDEAAAEIRSMLDEPAMTEQVRGGSPVDDATASAEANPV